MRELPWLHGTRFRRLAWAEWGDKDAPPVLCVHGLTRNGRDFDPLAAALADAFRVICPDLPGRGRSEWLGEAAEYQPAVYVQALAHLLAVIGRPVAWVGTSLGGICGMMVAAAAGAPVTRLVLNDLGPTIPQAALARISAYLREAPLFADVADAEAWMRRVHAPFGALTDSQWRALAVHSVRKLPDGRLAPHYDPAIARFPTPTADLDLTPFWSRVTVPVLAIRGMESDLLPPDVLARMQAEGAVALEVAGAGHAPALMDAPTMASVRKFLAG